MPDLFREPLTWHRALRALFQYQHQRRGHGLLTPESIDKGLRTVSRETSVRLVRSFMCIYCGGPLPGDSDQGDHVVPTARGGPNGFENWAPCCRSCNSSKGTRDLLDWKPFNTVALDVLVIYCRVMFQLLEREGRLDEPAPDFLCLS